MGDLKARLKPLFRRSSTFSSTKSSTSASSASDALGHGRNWSKSSLRLSKNKKPSFAFPVYEEKESSKHLPPSTPNNTQTSRQRDLHQTPETSPVTPQNFPQKQISQKPSEAPTQSNRRTERARDREGLSSETPGNLAVIDAGNTTGSLLPANRKRRQSLVQDDQLDLASGLLQPEILLAQRQTPNHPGEELTSRTMQQNKKIWVRRPGSSATQVIINEEDLVDDVRDMILRKYANSLGRTFDSPDVTLRIIFRHPSGKHSQTERTLGPEESVSNLLEIHYPGGQAVEEALIIDVPQRRTPKHSPHLAMPYYVHDDFRPRENGTDYFPQMPLQGQPSPHLPSNVSVSSGKGGPKAQHSIAVVTTGALPSLPSPGGRMSRHSQHRPKYGRQHTSSPTTLQSGANALQNHENLKSVTSQPMPTPPIPEEMTPHETPPPPRASSPRPKPNNNNSKRLKKPADQTPNAPKSVHDGAVPPINVLIVEDNIINLRLLEAFMKRLKVRWSTAMNGRDAVTKWREGGYHLVLMDIQLPVMNGLDATKEIRRLERVNDIGVFSHSTSTTPTFPNGESMDSIRQSKDSLLNTALFKSPVIIVALTASSLQSDRHEALAAGCNDFLTKPVNFEWLTRKVMEWGCMQALIDFDGWRKWKDFSQSKPDPSAPTAAPGSAKKVGSAAAAGGANNNTGKSPLKATLLNGKVQDGGRDRREREREKASLGVGGTGVGAGVGVGNAERQESESPVTAG